ncbi:MAG: rod shape-determining protein MreC [bacterium]|nr:rod shape-determining protein MreC [bacterium]
MLKRKSLFIILIILLLFPLGFKSYRNFLFRITSDFFYPFFSISQKIEKNIKQKSLLNKSKESLIVDIYTLQRKNSELTEKSNYLEQFKKENDELKKLLKLKVTPDFKYIFAEIITRDPIEWYQQFIINKGLSDGIQEGAIVLGRIKSSKNKLEFGVIGRIGTVSKHTSLVYTLLSNECQLSVSIPKNGASGVIQGGIRRGNNTWPIINFLPRDLTYKAYSKVITSGLNSLTPPNLKVGNLAKDANNKAATSLYNNLFIKAKVDLAVNLNHIDFVLILVKK